VQSSSSMIAFTLGSIIQADGSSMGCLAAPDQGSNANQSHA